MRSEPTETQKVLIEMLTENTGTHFLDSGGDSGRMWQRNQGKDFMSEKYGWWDWTGGLSVTKSAFHWLSEILEYDEEGDTLFQDFCTEEEQEDSSWHECREAWGEHVSQLGATGIYGDGDPFTTNTYNGEDACSQTLLFLYYELDSEEYCLLQIHGGADVRGGYTKPRLFKVTQEIAIFDNARAGCCCHDCEAGWYTDDTGYHWYPNNGEVELDKLELVELEEDQHFVPVNYEEVNEEKRKQLVFFEPDSDDEPEKLYQQTVDGEIKTYCPYCGTPLGVSHW